MCTTYNKTEADDTHYTLYTSASDQIDKRNGSPAHKPAAKEEKCAVNVNTYNILCFESVQFWPATLLQHISFHIELDTKLILSSVYRREVYKSSEQENTILKFKHKNQTESVRR